MPKSKKLITIMFCATVAGQAQAEFMKGDKFFTYLDKVL
jgi:hypothetical protein